jgi:hypothetical protein
VEALIRRAHHARQHPLAFFDFAWRHEITRERVTALPHQRVFFKFAYDHPLCCIRMPPGFSKTTCLVAMALWCLGTDETSRGAFVGAASDISKKPSSQLMELIEHIDEYSPEVRIVFPELRPSIRPTDPWSASKFVVERPPGIRDYSCSALGVGSKRVIGSRLQWIFVDDILTLENTRTPEQRGYVKQWLMQIAKARLDPADGRLVVTNVPYDPDDLTYYLERPSSHKQLAKRGAGWPTLSMNAHGRIMIANADKWDCEEIRPSARHEGTFRLVDHDSEEYTPRAYSWPQVERVLPEGKRAELVHCDLEEQVPLWPELFSNEKLESIKAGDEMSEVAYARNYAIDANAELLRKCKPEWIDRSFELAHLAGFYDMPMSFEPDDAWFTTTGIDIGGLRRGTHDDAAAVVTIATLRVHIDLGVQDKKGSRIVLRPGTKRLIDVKYGKWASRDLISVVARRVRAYRSFGRVERNSEESFRQWLEDTDALLPISGHTTGMNKHHVVHGVEAIFLAMSKGMFLIPNRDNHVRDEDLERFVEALRSYEPPPAHTDDGLMGAWMALEESRAIWQPPLAIVQDDRAQPNLGLAGLAAR